MRVSSQVQAAHGLGVLGCCLVSPITWPVHSSVDGHILGWGFSFPPQHLTTVLICFPVPNRCKKVCSHLCLLRPGGYSCACPQGSTFIAGSITECNAGRSAAWAATGPGRATLPSAVSSLPVLPILQEPEEPCLLGSLQNRVGMARRREERCGKYAQS